MDYYRIDVTGEGSGTLSLEGVADYDRIGELKMSPDGEIFLTITDLGGWVRLVLLNTGLPGHGDSLADVAEVASGFLEDHIKDEFAQLVEPDEPISSV